MAIPIHVARTPTAPSHTTVAAAHTTVAAARATGATNPPHPAVWQPWERLGVDAGTRFRTEIAAALAELELTQAESGKVLDVAYAAAAGAPHPPRPASFPPVNRDLAAPGAAAEA